MTLVAKCKRSARGLARLAGLDIGRAQVPCPAGSPQRPIGDVRSFLEDVRVRGFRPAGILDIGANRGGWAAMALGVFPGAPVILVEPQDEMEAPLRAFCAAQKGCHYVKAGAGRVSGVLLQTIWDDLAGSSFLPAADPRLQANGRQRPTAVTTVDTILRDIPSLHPTLVKLDVQGSELEALAGGESLFGRTELFIVETSLYRFQDRQPLLREIIAHMAERGYEVYDITEHLRRPSDGALGQLDIAFARREGPLMRSSAW